MGKDRFVVLAEKRVSKVIKGIELIGNLGNRANYDYTLTQVDQIFKAIEDALDQSKKRFSEKENKRSKSGFRFE